MYTSKEALVGIPPHKVPLVVPHHHCGAIAPLVCSTENRVRRSAQVEPGRRVEAECFKCVKPERERRAVRPEQQAACVDG